MTEINVNVKELQKALQVLQVIINTDPVSTGSSQKPHVEAVLKKRLQTHYKRKPIKV